MTIPHAHAADPVRRLTPLRQLSQVRERRALATCELRDRARLAAEQASCEAAEVVQRLCQAREEVLANVWQAGPCVTGQALQHAVQCAQHLAQQTQVAQRKAREAEAAAANALAQWRDARAAQAAAQRESHKLGELIAVQAQVQRRELERRAARLGDDEGALRAAAAQGRASW